MRGQGSGPRFFSPVLSITHKKAKKKSCRNTRLLRIDNGTQKPMILENKVRKQELWPPARGRKSMENAALITDIQRCSVHDGPGIRTTVFFQGLPPALHLVP